jgi:hypothetical protein
MCGASLMAPALTSRDRQPFNLPANQLPELGFPSLFRLGDEKQEQPLTEVLFGVCLSTVHAMIKTILKLNSQLRQRQISQA